MLFALLLFSGAASALCSGTPSKDCAFYDAGDDSGCSGAPPNCASSIYNEVCLPTGCEPGISPICSCTSLFQCTGTVDCASINDEATCLSVSCYWQSVSCSLGTGATCTVGSSPPACCSSDMQCQSGTCCVVKGGAAACSADADCCDGSLQCQSGRCCMGAASASACSMDADCCAGLVCDTGSHHCAPLIVACKTASQPCTASPDNCCKAPGVPADLYCDNLNNPSNPICTAGGFLGDRCDSRVGCASPLYCEAATGTCSQVPVASGPSCKAEGQPCSGASDCCASFQCSTASHLCEKREFPVCSSGSFNDIMLLSGVAGLGMAIIVALVFMAGQAMQNPRMLSWAKSELWEVMFSLFVAGLILFCIFTFCSLQVGEIAQVSSQLPGIFIGHETANTYDAAAMYLENVAGFGLRNIAAIRSNLGAYEMRTSFQQYECSPLCFMTLTSFINAKYSGESVDLAVSNNLLGTATVSYLSVLFQYFTMQYVVSGLFVVFLPIAIVVRSIPFMRNFGGAMVGIILALYIMYPLSQISSAISAPYLASGLGGISFPDRDGTSCAGMGVFTSPSGANPISCQPAKLEKNLGSDWLHASTLPGPWSMQELIKANVLMFLVGVFLPALNFIIIIALARDISGLLGDEADISRIGQMV